MNPSETLHPDALLAADALLPGTLTAAEGEQLADHLASCSLCRETHAENLAMHQALADALAPARPDGGFESRLARAFREQTGDEFGEWLRAMPGRVRWQRLAWQGAVLFVIGGVLASFSLPALQNAQVSSRRARDMALTRRQNEFTDQTGKDEAAAGLLRSQTTVDLNAATSSVQERERTRQRALKNDSPGPATGALAPATPAATPAAGRFVGQVNYGNPVATSDSRAGENGVLSLNRVQTDAQPAERFAYAGAPPANAPTAEPTNPAAVPAPDPARKLIRNAAVELLLAGPFDPAADALANLAREAGGYVAANADNRQPNGKRRGVLTIKVLPDRLDAFLLRLRELGEVRGQNVSTEDVTKAYFDTEARQRNAARLEERLLKMLDEVKGKLSEVLQVEKELSRVREEAETAQGELKVMDALIRYATITVTLTERDLDQPAAFLLQRRANLALLANDVERTLADARRLAADAGAQITAANADRNGPNQSASATLSLLVAPDRADALFAALRGLGRVERFNVTDQRTVQDGGRGQPGLEGKTTLAPVALDLSVRHDEQTRRQTTLTVAAGNRDVDAAFEKARLAAVALPGAEIVQSFLNHPSEGRANATIGVRLPGRAAAGLLETFRALGRPTNLQTHRDADAPEDAGLAPELLTLTLVDEEAAVQDTALRVEVAAGPGVESQLPAIRQAAADAGAEIRRSTFVRAGDGSETAELRFRLPLSKAPALAARLQGFGRTRDFTVRRQDRPNVADEGNAPAEIALTLQSPGRLFNEDAGVWATLRRTLAQSVGAIGWSVRMIGVVVAFLAPWAAALALVVWITRRVRRARRGKA